MGLTTGKSDFFCIISTTYENEKGMKVLKIQTKDLLNMKMAAIYLSFVFRVEVKTKSKDKSIEF